MTTPTDPQRLKVSAQAVGTDNPQLAYTLANSGLTSAQIQAVGGFASALQTNTTGQLVADSGVTPNYTTQEQNHFDALGVQPPGKPAGPPDTRNWFEKALDTVGGAISNGGNFIFHNPVTHGVLTGLDWINNAAHMPWRLMSEAASHDDTAENTEMQKLGYDPNSGLSKFWFLWNHGESEYHNLDNVRAQYTDKLVDLAVQQQADPEAFQQQWEQMDPTTAQELGKTLGSEEYKQAFAAVDALHISPGRDIANMVFAPFHANTENNEAFKLLSGTLDGVYTWMADPTLAAGKIKVGLRAADVLGRTSENMNLTTRLLTKMVGGGGLIASKARGIRNVLDQPGIYKAMGVSEDGQKIVEDTEVSKGWDDFLTRAKALREAQARADDASLSEPEQLAAQTEAAKLYAQLDSAHRELMPLLPEINGARVLAPKKLEFDDKGVLHVEQEMRQLHEPDHNLDDQADFRAAVDNGEITGGVSEETIRRYIKADEKPFPVRSPDDPIDPETGATPAEEAWHEQLENAKAALMRQHLRWRIGRGDKVVHREGGYETSDDPEDEYRDFTLDASRIDNLPPWVLNDPANFHVAQAPQTFDQTITSRLSGGWIATTGAPIEDRAEAARYLVSTGGLLRLANGEAAAATMVMPGKVSWWAERMAARKANSAVKWINYVSDWHKLMPTDAENDALTKLDEAGGDLSLRARLGDIQHNLLRTGTADGQGFNYFRRARVRMERVNRRLSTTLPDIRHFDLTDPSTLKDVERYARFYLNKGDARLLAARYATGDLATRRGVVRGMLTQTFHAAGLYRTPAGTKFADEFLRDFDQQLYGLEGTDLVKTDRGVVHGALYNSQLSTTVPMPPLKQLNQLAVRFAVDSWASKLGFTAAMGAIQSNRMDALYGHIKMGWITSAASGFRNALDEAAGFLAKGMGRQWIQGRVAYTQMTKDARKERRDFSVKYLKLKREYGKDYADDYVGEMSGTAEHSLEQAQRDYENAQKAERGRAEVTPDRAAELEDLIAQRGWLSLDQATTNLRAAEEAQKEARGLENAIHYRIPYIARRVADGVNDVLVGSALGKLLSVHPRWKVTPDRIEKLKELQDEERRAVLRDGVQQTHFADSYGAIAGEDGAMYLARNGMMHRRYAYRFRGWGQVEPDGGKGADGFAKYLQLRFADPTEASHEWLAAVREGLAKPEYKTLASRDFHHQLLYGEVPGVSEDTYRRVREVQDRIDNGDLPPDVEVEDYAEADRINSMDMAEARRQALYEHLVHELENGRSIRILSPTTSLSDPEEWGEVHSVEQLHRELARTDLELEHPELATVGNGDLAQPDVFQTQTRRQGVLDRNVLKDARDRVRAHLDKPEMRHFLANAEVMRFLEDGTRVTNPVQLERAKDELADRISADLTHGLVARGGAPVWVPEEELNGWTLARQVAQGTHGFPVPDDVRERIVDLQRRTDSLDGDIGRIGEGGNVDMRNQLDPEAAWGDEQARLAKEHFLLNEVRNGRPVFYDFEGEGQHWRRIDNEAELQHVIDDDYVSLDDPAAFVHGRQEVGNARISQPLLDQLAQAKELGVPDRSWLVNNVPVEDRPEWTVGELWAPFNPQHAPEDRPRGYTQMMGRAYEKVVTDQINALSRNPLMAALYVNARENIAPWEKHLVDAGWDEESAKQVAMRMSLMHAEQEAYKHIDNPWVASQFSLISRNFVNFERAQEDWLRRWGRAIKDNPAIIRKGQLALHAGTATGMLDQDPQTGELNFVYPGSQLAMRVFNSAMQGLGLGNVMKIPVVQELTSQVQFLSPSLQQPFGLTASPLLVLPFKALAATVGQHHQLLMQTIDKAMNGELGSGRAFYEQVLPPTINRIIRGVIMSDPGSQYGQAYTNATMALAASGHFEGLDGTDPSKISATQDKIATQTRNNMVLNTLFGFFAPATPTAEFNTDFTNRDGYNGNTPDWTAHIAGYRTLKSEAQKALADLGPTRFRLWWAAVHPHELIWDPTAGVGSHTKAGTNNAYLPSTIQAAKWAEDNPQFRAKYGGAGGVAAYFVPTYQNILGYDTKGNPIIGPSDPNQEFNSVAYRAQLEDHMREYKPLNELLPDIIIQRGEAEYYARKDVMDAQIADATASGNTYEAKQLEDQWSQEKHDIYQRNPLLAQKNASFATNGAVQQVALGQLHELVKDHSAATTKAIGPLRQGVQFLLQAYDDYQTAEKALAGRRGGFATAQRSQNLENYQTEVQSVAQQYPDLADLVRGVFRTP